MTTESTSAAALTASSSELASSHYERGRPGSENLATPRAAAADPARCSRAGGPARQQCLHRFGRPALGNVLVGADPGPGRQVGAKSDVLSDVPDGAVVMGTPARRVGIRDEASA